MKFNLQKRLKAGVKAFLNPRQLQLSKLRDVPPEPQVIISDRLLENKNVLITGAGYNIGKSIALEMAQQGAHIFAIERTRERAEKLQNELNPYPIQVKCFIFDISQHEEIVNLCNELEASQIDIDILVNNVARKTDKIGMKSWELEDGGTTVYLASDYFSKFTTGTILKIDAGLSLYNSRFHEHPPH